MQKQYLTADDLIERWGRVITRGTLANWRSKRVGPPFVKLGTRVVYPVEALTDWEKQHQHEGSKNDNRPGV